MTDNQATPHRGRAFDLAAGQAWGILPECLEQILAIAERTNEDPEAVAAKLGRPLDNTRAVTVRDGVAIIPVIGPVMRYANIFTQISGGTSIQELATDFTAAVEDPKITGIILEIDSPGGTVAGVSEFAEMVFQARGRKPIVAYVSNLGASAAYWIASAAEQIALSKTSMVGSIGVVTSYYKGKDNRTGEIVSSQSPNKRPDMETEAGRSQIQRQVDRLADVFVETVARNRGVTTDTVLADFGQGGMLVGQDAVDTGLADQIASLESVITDLKAGITGGSRSSVKKGDPKMDQTTQAPAITTTQEITANTIATSYPQIAEQFRAEGAQAERARIQAVEDQLMPGHEALIQTLKFDGKTSGPEAAMAVLQAEKQAQAKVLTSIKADAPKPLPTPAVDASAPAAEAPKAAEAKTPEEQFGAEWDADAKLQAELDRDAYIKWAVIHAEKRV